MCVGFFKSPSILFSSTTRRGITRASPSAFTFIYQAGLSTPCFYYRPQNLWYEYEYEYPSGAYSYSYSYSYEYCSARTRIQRVLVLSYWYDKPFCPSETTVLLRMSQDDVDVHIEEGKRRVDVYYSDGSSSFTDGAISLYWRWRGLYQSREPLERRCACVVCQTMSQTPSCYTPLVSSFAFCLSSFAFASLFGPIGYDGCRALATAGKHRKAVGWGRQ